jgi:hypothetical protein
MPSAGFETATQATKRPQTYALDRSATGIGPRTCKEQNLEIKSVPQTSQVRVLNLEITLDSSSRELHNPNFIVTFATQTPVSTTIEPEPFFVIFYKFRYLQWIWIVGL